MCSLFKMQVTLKNTGLSLHKVAVCTQKYKDYCNETNKGKNNCWKFKYMYDMSLL
jgi:hypothetical protein